MAIKKLLELRGDDWMKGISLHKTIPIGGIFQSASNFDPFRVMGFLRPSPTPTAFTDAGSVYDKVIKYMVPFTDGSGKIYAYAGTAASELYELDTILNTITNRTTNITATGPARGAGMYKGRFVYFFDSAVKSRPADVTSGSDVDVLTSGINAGEHPPVLGADLNLYFPNGVSIGRITDPTTTAATNTGNVFSLETGMTIRDMRNDGRYLVFIADDRSSALGSSTTGVANCVIGYWDYTSGVLTQRYDFKDAGMVGLEILEGNAHVFGLDNIYVCNVATFPQSILNFRQAATANGWQGTQPSLASSITRRGNSILWTDSAGKVYGYGSLVAGQKKVFFHSNTATASASGGTSVICFNGSNLIQAYFDGTSTYKVYNHDGSGAGFDTAVVSTSNISLDRPYALHSIRLVTRIPLASGDSISVTFVNQLTSNNPFGTQTFSFTADGAKTSKVFYPGVSSGSRNIFNEIASLGISANTTVESVAVYGEEVEIFDQSF